MAIAPCGDQFEKRMNIQVLDVVALTEPVPSHGLVRGQVGTVVETLPPDAFEVEFSDDDGRTYATLGLRANQLLVLHYRPLQGGMNNTEPAHRPLENPVESRHV
jgi:hypothetical protein